MTEKAKRDNPEISEEEAKLIGLQGYYALEQSVAQSRVGIQGDESNLGRLQAVENHMLDYARDLTLSSVPLGERAAAIAAERRRIEALYGVTPGSSTSAQSAVSTGLGELPDDDLFDF